MNNPNIEHYFKTLEDAMFQMEEKDLAHFFWVCEWRMLPFIGAKGHLEGTLPKNVNQQLIQRQIYELFYTLDIISCNNFIVTKIPHEFSWSLLGDSIDSLPVVFTSYVTLNYYAFHVSRMISDYDRGDNDDDNDDLCCEYMESCHNTIDAIRKLLYNGFMNATQQPVSIKCEEFCIGIVELLISDIRKSLQKEFCIEKVGVNGLA